MKNLDKLNKNLDKKPFKWAVTRWYFWIAVVLFSGLIILKGYGILSGFLTAFLSLAVVFAVVRTIFFKPFWKKKEE